MTLQKLRREIEKGERGEFFDGDNGATAAMFGVLHSQIKNACWNIGFKAEASELAGRAEKLAYSPDSPYYRN